MTDQELIQAVKEIVLRFDPNAQVILYGSRARGDAQPDSDWDFLVLLDREKTQEVEREMNRTLYDLELKSGEFISTVIHSKDEWAQPLMRATPFYRSVMSNSPVCADKNNLDLSPEVKVLVQLTVDRAKEAFTAASLLINANHRHGALRFLYYACFYTVKALLLAQGMFAAKHSGVRALFNDQLVAAGSVRMESGAFYDRLFDRWLESDYGDVVEIGVDEILDFQQGARAFTEELLSLIQERIETAVFKT